MGDKGGKKDKDKQHKQQEKRAQSKAQRQVEKVRAPGASPSMRQTQAASMQA